MSTLSSFTSLLPPLFPHVEEGLERWSATHTSEAFQKEFEESRRLIACVKNDQAISLYELNKTITVLKEWFEASSTQHALTFPFTQDGLVKALSIELEQQPTQAMPLLAQLFPYSTMKALQSMDKAPSQWRSLLLHVPSLTPVSQQVPQPSLPPAENEEPSRNVPPSDQATTSSFAHGEENIKDVKDKTVEEVQVMDSSTVKAKKEKYVPPVVSQQAEKIRRWLEAVSDETVPLPVRREAWTSKLKKSILHHKGAGTDATNYWFEDFFVHGLCGLNDQELGQVKNLWSDSFAVSFHHPSASMKNANLWRSLASMPFDTRQTLLTDILPHIIDTSLWSFKDRYYMFQSMAEQARDRPWLFEERLKFWEALGGDIMEEGPTGAKSDMFDMTSSQSVYQWIAEQKIPQWNTVIEKRKTPTVSSSFKP